jgi:hypothetical protein
MIFFFSNVFASNYSIEYNQFGNDLVVVESSNGGETIKVLKNSLDKSDEGYIFLQKIIAVDNFDDFRVGLILDKGVLIKSNEIFPIDGYLESNGETITIWWDYENISMGEEFVFFVSMEDNGFDFFWIYYILVALVLAVLIFLGIRYYLSRRKNVEKYLLDEERRIVEFLTHSDRHESWQRKIQEELSLSKAKTSRLIRNLESRGLLEKIPFGNTNKIRLK